MIKKYGQNIGLSKKLTPKELSQAKGNVCFDDRTGTYRI